MLKTIFANQKEENIKEIIKREMLKYTEWYLQTLAQKKDSENQKPGRLGTQNSVADGKVERVRMYSSQKMSESRMNLDRGNDVDSIYNASTFASLLGLEKEDLLSEDILNLIMYCSFDLEINCNFKEELKIFKSSERLIYKRIKEKLKKQVLKNASAVENSIIMSEEDDDLDLKYDSDSIKSTESIHEARRKIENPRKIITLLNNLNQINLSDPMEKAEFLKHVIDFEEKYGKLDEEEFAELTKRSQHESHPNTDRVKNEEKKPAEQKKIVEEAKAVLDPVNLQAKESMPILQPEKFKENFEILGKLDKLKQNYEELLIHTDRFAMESLAEDQNKAELQLDKLFPVSPEDLEKEMLFLTNPEVLSRDLNSSKVPPSTSKKTEEESKKAVQKTMESLNNEAKRAEKMESGKEAAKVTNKEKDKKRPEKTEKKTDKSKPEKEEKISKKDKNRSKAQEEEITKVKDSFHSKASKTSKNSMDSKGTSNGKNQAESSSLPKENPEDEKKQKLVKKNSIFDPKSKISRQGTRESPSPSKKKKPMDLKSPRTKKAREKAKDLEVFPSSEEEKGSEESGKDEGRTEVKQRRRKKMLTLALDKEKGKKEGDFGKIQFSSQREISSNLGSEEKDEVGSLEERSEMGQEIENEPTEKKEEGKNEESMAFKENRPSISDETDGKIVTKRDLGTLSSSRNDFESSGNQEDGYEMIDDDIRDEDLEILIKTSGKNAVLSQFKNEKTSKEMSAMRNKVLKRLEKQMGKKVLEKKLKKIEKNIEEFAKKDQQNADGNKQQPEIQFSQLDQIENQLFENFYKSNDEQFNAAHKDGNAFGEVFKRKLFEKLGISENERNNGVLTAFGNKMWEIKKRLNNHMSYLKKKMFFEKLDELFLQIIGENRWTTLKIGSKSDKKKLLNALTFLKPYIFSKIAKNNMIFDGIKILYVSGKKDKAQNIVQKLRSLLKKIKKAVGLIIFEALRNVYQKKRYYFPISDAFPAQNLNLGTQINYNSEINDSFLKSKSKMHKSKEDHQFSDYKLRTKTPDKMFLSKDENKKALVSKKNIEFPIKMRKPNRGYNKTVTNFGFSERKTNKNENLDRICYVYLDKFNISEKNKEYFLYYLTHLADPFLIDHSHTDDILQSDYALTPKHVYKMSKRIGINLIDNNEIDLVWIAYVMLIFPPPEVSSLSKSYAVTKSGYYDYVCDLGINEHPGDIYFAKALEVNRRRRTAFMNNHSAGQKFQIALTWLRFYNTDFYFFNFYLDKQGPAIPKLYQEYIKFIRKVFKRKLNDQKKGQKGVFTITSILELDRFANE